MDVEFQSDEDEFTAFLEEMCDPSRFADGGLFAEIDMEIESENLDDEDEVKRSVRENRWKMADYISKLIQRSVAETIHTYEDYDYILKNHLVDYWKIGATSIGFSHHYIEKMVQYEIDIYRLKQMDEHGSLE